MSGRVNAIWYLVAQVHSLCHLYRLSVFMSVSLSLSISMYMNLRLYIYTLTDSHSYTHKHASVYLHICTLNTPTGRYIWIYVGSQVYCRLKWKQVRQLKKKKRREEENEIAMLLKFYLHILRLVLLTDTSYIGLS